MIDIGADDFYNTIVELGEKIVFKRDTASADKNWQEDGIIQYASISPNRSNKAIATTEGSYLFTGVITFSSMEQQERLVGSYFKRTTQPNSMLMLYNVFPENSTPNFGIVSVYECNDKIDIISHYTDIGKNKFGEMEKKPVYAAKDVDCYISAYSKEPKTSPAGGIERTLFYLTLPAAFDISSESIVLKETLVQNRETHKVEVKKIPYNVASIDNTMMDIVDGKRVGTVKCLLMETQQK